MSPPLLIFNRRLAAPGALERARPLSVDLAAPDSGYLTTRRGQFLDSFSRRAAEEPLGADGDLEGPIAIAEAMARGGTLGEYAAVLQFRALQLERAGNPEDRAVVRRAALQWAEEALRGISTAPGFTRDRVRALYDTVIALSAILARDERGEMPETERQLLLRFFVQIRAGIEQHRLESAAHPEYPPIPAYFESYARAEQALLEGHAEAALAAFLETRDHIRAIPGSGLFRERVEDGTEYAIQALARDGSGLLLENLRGRYALDLLLLFDQVDGGDTAESQCLSLAALALAEGRYRGASARGILEYLSHFHTYNEAEAEDILDPLTFLYNERPEFREACAAQLHPEAGAAPREVCGELLQRAVRAATRILENAEREPYATALRRDTENRPLRRALELLQAHPEWRLSGLIGIHPTHPPRTQLQHLVEYGPLAETLLRGLPAALRETEDFQNFVRAVREVADADRHDRTRRRLEQPLEELVEAMATSSRDDERYAPAYEYFFRGLAESDGEIAPGITLPEGLRRRAAALRSTIVDFNGRRLARHLLAPDSLLSLAGGIALAELMPIGILRWGRNGGPWIRAGRLTWASELAVGLGVGAAMSTVGGVHHLATSSRPWREELPRILPTLALHTLFSSLAMGGTMLTGHGLRSALIREGSSRHLFLRHVGARTLTNFIGGGLLLGAETLSERIDTGRWRRPSAEQAAETYLNLLLWDTGAAGLRSIGRRFWPAAQLGPHHAVRESTPIEAARVPVVRDAEATPDKALPPEHRPRDMVYNIPFETLQRLWELPMRPLPREILSSPLLRPIHHLRVGTHDFYFSRVIEALQTHEGRTSTRRYVLALVPVEAEGRTVLKRRFFYASDSDAGAWRASPYMLGDFHLVKGVGRHYTQETQPVWEIAEALTRLEHAGPRPAVMRMRNLVRYISAQSEALGPAAMHTMQAGFPREVDFPSAMGLSELRGMQPGHAFAAPRGWNWNSRDALRNTLRQMRDLTWPEGFIPDFTAAPSRELFQPNSLLGPLRFREYRGATAVDRSTGRIRPIVWIMGQDSHGRAWVRHLHYGDSPVNSYGVYGEVLDSGILTSKPLEYLDQSALLSAPYRRPFNGEYADISPALTLLEPIRRYREARGLSPLLTEAERAEIANP